MAEDALRKLRPLHGVSRSCPPSGLSSKHGHGLPWPSAKIAAVHVAPIPARTSATTARMFTRPSIIRLPDDLPLLTGDQRGALPVTQTGLFPMADCHLCSPDLTRVILFHGLSLSHLRPFNQQPRGLCLLFILTILFPCAQDCDRCAQSVSVSLSRSWVLLGRTATFYAILYVAIIFH